MSALPHVLGHVALAPDLGAEEPEHLAALGLVEQLLPPLPRLRLEQAECEDIALALALVVGRVEGAHREVVLPASNHRQPSFHHCLSLLSVFAVPAQ
eukprot:15464635-Alexandrium_andersonii.AAC.1